MKTYRVKVLETGKLTVDKSILTRGVGCGMEVTVPARVLAVEGNGIKVLVDTGISQDVQNYIEIEGVGVAEAGGKDVLEAALGSIGWKAEDVDFVVNTHLHFGNCGNNSLFRNARLFVQRKEWEFALQPSESQKKYYVPSLLHNGAGVGVNLELLDGEHELAEGIVLLPTPGHSRGHQSVLINTEEGVVCYAGHAVNLMENLSDNVIGNVLDDTREAFFSMEKIRRTSAFLIPGYDTQVAANAESGFLKVHK